MTYICPHCRCEVLDGEKCPHCKIPFHASDWPEIAVTPAGRVRPAADDGAYFFPPQDSLVHGAVNRPYTEELPSPAVRSRISVGGRKQHVEIAGNVSAPLAEFYRHLITGGDEWWVVRCSGEAKIVLNGKEEIDNCRLSEGDIVTIADVPFLFTGKSLRIGQIDLPEICLETRDLTVRKKGKTILEKIRFKIEPGEFIGILGPSGCGKSSLIQQLVGLGKSTSGSICINGEPYAKSADVMSLLTAYMPQTVALHNDLTLQEEIQCFSRLHSASPDDAEAKLALVGMRQETAKRIGDLSGGQQRRVGIALELLREPLLLILDEPTAGLDPASETQVMTYLRRLADQGKSVLCATHIMENLNKFDKILVLSRGYEVFFGTPEELLSFFEITRPQELYDLLGSGSEEQQRERAEKEAKRFRDHQDPAPDGEAKRTGRPLSECCGQGASWKNRFMRLKDQFLGYLQRQVMELFSFRHAPRPVLSFLTSACFIQLLLQPVLIAFALRLACSHLFYVNGASRLFDLFFFSCLAVFWFGLNNAVRELVRERIPWRCLERLEKISMAGYIGAKLSWTALLAFVQTLLFYLLVFVMKPASVINNAGDSIYVTGSTVGFLMLYGVCISGAWIGLAISAVFTSEKAAVAMLPIILVPVLFFSGTIIGDVFEGEHPEKSGIFNMTAASIEKWMPCHAPAEYLKNYTDYLNKNKAEPSPRIPIRNGGITVLIFLTLLTILQYAQEKKWEGR